MNDGAVFANEIDCGDGIGGCRREGLFAEDGLSRRDGGFQQGQMPCVFGADDEAVDVVA